jgi:hypothetical protein
MAEDSNTEVTPISSARANGKTHKGPKGSARRKKVKGQRASSPQRPYPRVPLEKAVEVARAIKEKNGGNPWEADQIARVLGVSAKGVGFVYTLLGARRFGLTEGTNPKGQVSLTGLGREAVYGGTPDEELAAKRKAFLSIDIFNQVLEHYKGSKLPEMQYLGNTLQTKFNLPPEFHEEFSALFKRNSEYVGLGQGSVEGAAGKGGSASESASSEVVVLGEPKQKTGLVCFVIMPFVEKTTAFSKGFFDEVLNSLIIPAARNAGFEVKTANRQGTEMIHSTIVNEILDADMCICDLTEHNPNVLFELGMRLANDKPVALIQAEGTARVFDVDNVLRVFPYQKELWRSTLQKDLPDLTGHIRATWDNRDVNESYYRILRARKPQAKDTAA